MKSKILLVVSVLFISLTTNAQKVGTVNSDLVIGKMPQMKQVLIRLQKYGVKLDSTFQLKFKNYQDKVNAYRKVEKTLTKEVKQTRSKELFDLEDELKKAKSNGDQMITLRRNELMRPLYQKLSEVVAQIAKEKGYSHVLTTNGNEFAYIDPNHDITKLVLDKLGIKLEEVKK